MSYRNVRRVGALVAMVAFVVGCGTDRSAAPTSKTAMVTSKSVVHAPSTRLVVLRSGKLQIVNATSGIVLRTVAIHGSTSDLDDLLMALAVTPNGRNVYLQRSARRCEDSAVVRISLITGEQTTVVGHALDPALSPNGRVLAYNATVAPPPGYPDFCETGRTYVRDLLTGSVRSWDITIHPGKNRSPQLLDGLTWSPDGRRLAVSSMYGPYSGIQILNPTAAQSASNPAAVPSKQAYYPPIILPDGNIQAILDPCPDSESCGVPPPNKHFSVVSVLNPASGRVISSFRSKWGDCELTIDPSGRRIEVSVCTRTKPSIYRLIGHRLVLTTTRVDGVGWLPAKP